MARRLPPASALAIGGLLAACVAARTAAALGLQSPWIAPDEMAYGLLGRSFWTTGHLRLLDGTSPFYGLYPVVAGLPLALFGTVAGLMVLKVAQVLLMTAAVAIVYEWTRRLTGNWWALAAAAMTAALPALAYSGLIMKEALFLPATTLALWLVARALTEPSVRNQMIALAASLLAIALRLQGIILIPAIVISVLLMAWFSREARTLRRFAPTLGLLGGAALIWIVFTGGPLGRFTNLTSDTPVTTHSFFNLLRNGYAFGSLLSWTWRQVGDIFLLVGGAPLIATLVLAMSAFRGRESDPRVRALLALTLAYGVLLVIEVGAFASRFAGLLAERQAITLAPPLFVAFAIWLHRGMPRPQPSTTIAAVAIAAPAFLLPVHKVITTSVVPSAFMMIPFFDLLERTSGRVLQVVWLLAVGIAVGVTVLLPRRVAPLLAALVLAALAVTSGLAQSMVDSRAHSDRTDFFGMSSPQWIDRATTGPVAYLDDGDPLWNAAWQFAFWNEKLRTVLRIGPAAFGALPVSPQPDGVLIGPGIPLSGRLVVTRRNVTLVGRRLEQRPQGPDEPGLVLWQTPSTTPKLSQLTQGLRGNVLISDPVSVTVFDCRGRLRIGLRAEHGDATADVSVNGLRSVRLTLPDRALVQGSVPAPPAVDPHTECVYTISPRGYVVADEIEFERGSSTIRFTPGRTAFLGRAGVQRPTNVAYCVDGSFQVLKARPRGATPAIFVSGRGLTCDLPPEGYVHKGFATPDLGVPAHTYPLYSSR